MWYINVLHPIANQGVLEMLFAIDNVSILGFIAGGLTTFGFLPQVVKAVRTKSTHDISLGMVTLTSTGIFLWFVYGLCLGSLPIILPNFISSMLTFTLLVLKIKYR
jgi:MtN3 and saliva related transmembrane protein